jgi:hypothetical protein
MKTNFPPVVFLASSRTTLPPAHIHEADDATAEAFRWLLALGFPADVAAARVMPELFAEPVAQIDTAAPFPRSFEAPRAA